MNELISIIIPVYNVEKYIDRCLESILNQSYQNIEIIIINDGSTDESLKICEKYSKNKKIKKIITTQNHGVGNARNIGIENCSGEYIIFIDSDDYIEHNMIEILYKNSKKYDADISICNYNYIINEKKHRNQASSTQIIDKDNFYKMIFDKNYYKGFLWNKLIKRNLIIKEKTTIKFDTNIHMMEDLVLLCKIAENMKRAYYASDEYLYNYVKRENSALNTEFNNRTYSALKAFKILEEYVIKYSSDNNDEFYYDYIICAMRAKFYMKDILNSDEKKELKKIRRKYLKKIIFSSKKSVKEKIKLLNMAYLNNLYFNLKNYVKSHK